MKDNIYNAVQGDTWDLIAKKVYDDEMLVKEFLEANRNISHIFVFAGGERVIIPEIKVGIENNIPNWRK
jgi:phage tail protein X|nr:MAG TPA: tail protein [Caudoviricetes sp.]